MADALRLQTNVPETIALEFTDGLPVASKFGGDQLMFSLVDGRKLFVAPIVAQKIAAAGIAPGQEFSICKAEVLNGNRRMIEYQVAPLTEETGATKTPSHGVASAPVSSNHSTPAARNGLHAVTAPAAAPAVPDVQPSAVALMKVAGIGAVDAVLEVEKYAQSRGMVDFAFGADNVQKIAACLFIELCKKAGRA